MMERIRESVGQTVPSDHFACQAEWVRNSECPNTHNVNVLKDCLIRGIDWVILLTIPGPGTTKTPGIIVTRSREIVRYAYWTAKRVRLHKGFSHKLPSPKCGNGFGIPQVAWPQGMPPLSPVKGWLTGSLVFCFYPPPPCLPPTFSWASLIGFISLHKIHR